MANSSIITTANICEQFAGTSLPADPTDTIELPGSQHWPASLREQLSGTLRPAGVLIPIFERADTGLSVLLTQRSAALTHHAGQISFPGGRMELEDGDIAVTALRETAEEVGIGSEHVTVVGNLPAMPTITGYAVTPIIGLVAAGAMTKIDRSEVEFAFEVPLTFLLEPGNRRTVQRELYGKTIAMDEFHYEQHRIWGATAVMIMEFIKVIKTNKL